MNGNKPTIWEIVARTAVVHTLTYFAIGLIAYSLFDYSARFADPALNSLMRQTDDPLVQAGVLFQPIRGVLFGLVFYLLRDVLFRQKNGWLVMWITFSSDRHNLNFRHCARFNRGSDLHESILRWFVGWRSRGSLPVLPSFGSPLLLGDAFRKEMAQLGPWTLVLYRTGPSWAWPLGAPSHFVAGDPTSTHASIRQYHDSA
jgi:hypothetical protein